MPKDETIRFSADRLDDESLELIRIRKKAFEWWKKRNPKRKGNLVVPTVHGRFYTPGYQ